MAHLDFRTSLPADRLHLGAYGIPTPDERFAAALEREWKKSRWHADVRMFFPGGNALRKIDKCLTSFRAADRVTLDFLPGRKYVLTGWNRIPLSSHIPP